MKLERINEYVLPTVVMALGMGFAAYAGRLMGHGQIGPLLTLFLAICIGVIALIMRQAMWMFIPIAWGLAGQIPILPLPFAIRDLVIMSVFCCFLAFKALKVVRRKPQHGLLDLWLALILLYLASVYIRNPVGVDALGSERVGGRPYLNVFIAYLGYWVLSRASLTDWQARFLPALTAFGHSIEGLLNMLTFHIPQAAPLLAPYYSGVTLETYNAGDVRRGPEGAHGSGRRAYLMLIGSPVAMAMIAYIRPITLITPIYLLRFTCFMFILVCVLLSGFRSIVVGIFAAIIIGSYMRQGLSEVLRLAAIGGPALALLLAMQGVLFELPLSAQRALSFLPGRWDPLAVQEAKASTQWRVEMWTTVLLTDKYIENKLLGDGFGFTRRALQTMNALREQDFSTEGAQENAMLTGGFHSGPLSAIRYVGVVGLVMFVILLLMMAREALRLAGRAKGTAFHVIAMYVGIPMVWEPVNYLLIFGAYDAALPNVILGLGMMKMLGNTLGDQTPAKLAGETVPRLRDAMVVRPRRLSPVPLEAGSPG